jgi:hypothetical protein
MKTRLVCAHAGGQGKTTVSQTLYALSLESGLEPKLAAADFKDETGSSKIGRLFPGLVRELGTGPNVSLSKLNNDVNANVKYWDALGPLLLKGGYIIDLGANVVDQVLNWGEIRQASRLLAAKDAPAIDVYLVCKPEKRAVDDMSDLVKRFSARTSLPVDEINIVMNSVSGNFDNLNLRATLAHAAGDTKIRFIEFPNCISELWVPMEQNYCSVSSVLSLDEDQISDILKVDFWSILSGVNDMRSWYEKVKANLKAARQ